MKTSTIDHASPARGMRAALAGLVLAALMLLASAWPSGGARAQQAPAPYTPQELEQMLAPVALYPDALLAQTLMACSYPAEVTMAADWLRRNPQWKDKGDDAVRAVDGQPWDASVRSLVAFPQVLEMLDAHPDWTLQVGTAFVTQQSDTMSAVQSLRVQAQLAGNLESNQQVKVVKQTQTIVIQPVNPQVIYVPTYDPTYVFNAWPYPAFPPYYLPPPPGYYVGSALAAGIAFGTGIAITNAIWGGFDWGRGDVNINVNNFNSIHVSNRENYLRNDGRWQHDKTHRRDVPLDDRASRERLKRTASNNRDRADFAGHDRDPQRPAGSRPAVDRPAARPATPDRPAPGARPGVPDGPSARPAVDRPAPQRPATRPAVPDRGAFEGIDRPTRDRPTAATRPAPSPAARPAPAPRPSPAARPAPRPAPAARPAPRPAPSARPAPRPAARPAARPAPRPAARPAAAPRRQAR